MKRGRVRKKGRLGLTSLANTDLHRIRLASIGSGRPPPDLAKSLTESGTCHQICAWGPSRRLHARERGTPVCPCCLHAREGNGGVPVVLVTLTLVVLIASTRMERKRHGMQIYHATPPCRSGLVASMMDSKVLLWFNSPPRQSEARVLLKLT